MTPTPRRPVPLAAVLSLSAAAACAARSGPSGGGPAPAAGGKILDTHIHFYQVSRPGLPWPPAKAKPLYRDVLPAEYKALARRHGIVGSGIVEASPRPEDNRWILEITKDDPFFPFFVASLDLGAADFPTQLDELARDPRVVGIRGFLWSPTLALDERQLANARALAARGMTLDLISRGTLNPKDKVAALAAAVPDLRIIIDHLGGAAGPRPSSQWERDMRMLATHGNIHVKFSSFFDMHNTTGGEDAPWTAPTTLDAYAPHFDVLMEAFGPHRLIWGSNWPVSDLGGDFGRQIALAEEYLARFGPEARDKVMYLNAERFYRRSATQR